MDADARTAQLARVDQKVAAVLTEFDEMAAEFDEMDSAVAAAAMGMALRNGLATRDQLCAFLATLAIKLRRADR